MHRRTRHTAAAIAAAGAVLAATLVPAPAATAAASVTTPNLIVNGDAEGGAGRPVPGWTVRTGTTFEAQAYGQGGFPALTDPGPTNRGAALFAGGLPPIGDDQRLEVVSQSRSLTPYGASIDAGTATFNLNGYLGGFSDQRDYAIVEVRFYAPGNVSLGSARIGPVTPAQRHLQKGLLKRKVTGTVPAGSRKVVVTLTLRRFDGAYNDGYADNLILTLTTV